MGVQRHASHSGAEARVTAGRRSSARLRSVVSACAVLVVTVALLAGCRGPQTTQAPSGPTSQRLRIVTTIYPLADWVKQIAGERVEVTCLLKSGMSPHTYEPTPQDMEMISRTDAFFAVGLGLEEWVGKMASATEGGRSNMHSLGDETFAREAAGSPDQLIGDNPHVWLDAKVAAAMCRQLVADLEQTRPDLRGTFGQGLAAYETQLDGLAKECEAAFPGQHEKGVVTFHNGFTYLLRRCGLKQLGVIEEFPGKEPSAGYLEDLVKQMRGFGQKVIFAEPQLSDKAAQVIAHEIGGRVEILDYLGDPSLPDRDTYVEMIRYNVARLKDALQ